ncbi:MAG: hypothetical protein LBC56_04125 [Oscillospiraceae bacterium]|jgi:hypothetical protein|nr:hypothetical protein [Oscillospiraceae bacterium]
MLKKILYIFFLIILILSCSCNDSASVVSESSYYVPELAPEEAFAPSREKDNIQYYWENCVANAAFSFSQLKDDGFDSPAGIYPSDAARYIANALIWSGEYTYYISTENSRGFFEAPDTYGGAVNLDVPYEDFTALIAGCFGEEYVESLSRLEDWEKPPKKVRISGSSMFIRSRLGSRGGLGLYNGQSIGRISLADVIEEENGVLACDLYSSGALQKGEDDSRISAVHKLRISLSGDGIRILSSSTNYIPAGRIQISDGFRPYENLGGLGIDGLDVYGMFQGIMGEEALYLEYVQDSQGKLIDQVIFTIDPESAQRTKETHADPASFGAINNLAQILGFGPVFRSGGKLLLFDNALNFVRDFELPADVDDDYKLSEDFQKLYYCSSRGFAVHSYDTGESRLFAGNGGGGFACAEVWEEQDLLFAKSYDMESRQSMLYLFELESGDIIARREGIEFIGAPVFTEDNMILIREAKPQEGSGGYKSIIYNASSGQWSEKTYGDFTPFAGFCSRRENVYFFRPQEIDGVNQFTLAALNLLTGEERDLGLKSFVACPQIHGVTAGGIFVIGVYYPGYKSIGCFY